MELVTQQRAECASPGPGPRRLSLKYDGILFDIGDTLIHFETSRIRDIIRATCRPGYERMVELGHRLPRYDKYLRCVTRAFLAELVWSKISRREIQLLRCLRRVHRRFGFDLGPDELLEVASRTTVPAMRQLAIVDPTAVSTMRRLRLLGVKLGLVSNTVFPAFAIDSYLEEVNLLEFFSTRVYSSAVRYMKPHRRIFELALREFDLPADRILFVGDRVDKDVFGALRVGMDTALFARDDRKPRRGAQPHHVINCLTQIPALVR